MKKINFLVLLFLFANIYVSAQEWTQVGENLEFEGMVFNSIALNGDGDIVAMSPTYFNSSTEIEGLVRVMQRNGDDFVQLGQDIRFGDLASFTTYGKTSGLALSLSDDGQTLLIGAPYHNANGNAAGAVRVYKFDGTNWNQFGADIYGEPSRNFGFSVALTADGNSFVVGASANLISTDFSGSIHTYTLDGSLYVPVGQTIFHIASEGYGFGQDVDINDAGNIITATYTGTTAKVYQLDGSVWIEIGNFSDMGYQYASLNAEGNRIALGAPYQTNPNTNTSFTGGATVYDYDNGTWTKVGSSMYGNQMFRNFGRVRLNAVGDVLAIGSTGISSQKGFTEMYKLVEEDWSQTGRIEDSMNGSFFGHNVGLSNDGNVVAIGSREGPGSNQIHHGKVYEFICNDDAPVALASEAVCENSTVTLSVTTTEGNIINWYDSADATEPIFTGTEFETPELSETTTYYVEAVTSLGCASSRIEVIATILPAPELIIKETEIAICEANEARLYAESPNNVIFWYANESDEEYIYHGNLFVTDELTDNTTFWVEAYNLSTGCVSERTQVTVTVSEAIESPIAESTQEFQAGLTLADLEVEHTGFLTWYADAALTQELPETTVVVAGTTYFVTQSSGACESTSIAILVDTFLENGNLNNDKFAFYPNPVKDVLTITNADEIKSVSVYDLTGRKIKAQSINSKEAKINLSDLKSGNYVVHIETSKELKSLKIIKK